LHEEGLARSLIRWQRVYPEFPPDYEGIGHLLGWYLRCARSWHNGRRNLHGTDRRRCHGGLQNAARCAGAKVAKIGQCQRAGKKHGRQNCSAAREEIGTSTGTKQAAGTAATKRSAHISALAMLDQNQSNHDQRRNHLQCQDY